MKILCIGRNYVKHVEELKNIVLSEPAVFLKPETALLKESEAFQIPIFSNEIHHEIEIVLKIGKSCKHISEENALDCIEAVTVGIDFTARDIQDKLKESRLSWELSKAFDGSASVGNWISLKEFGKLENIDFYLNINNQMVQKGNSNEMIFSFKKIISFISTYFTLETGDIIFTGTPAGVGPIKNGDVLKGFLKGNQSFEINIHEEKF